MSDEVEVLRVVTDKQCPIVRKNVGSALDLHAGPNCMHCEGTGFVVKYVDRAHVTRLTAKRDGLKMQLADSDHCYRQAHDTGVMVMRERDILKTELTKAVEFLQKALQYDAEPELWLCISEFLVHQSEPAAKGEESESVRNQCDGCQAGIPLVNGAHRMGKPGGYPDRMSCTAKLYKDKQ